MPLDDKTPRTYLECAGSLSSILLLFLQLVIHVGVVFQLFFLKMPGFLSLQILLFMYSIPENKCGYSLKKKISYDQLGSIK